MNEKEAGMQCDQISLKNLAISRNENFPNA